MARLLYPDQSTEPFRVTVLYPELDRDAARAAERLEAAAVEHTTIKGRDAAGRGPLRRTTFSLAQVEEFHELYHLIERSIGAAALELLVNDRPLPLARELWLPLIWALRK